MTAALDAVAALAAAQLAPIAPVGAAMSPVPAAGVDGASFGPIVSQGLDQVNETLMASQVELQQLAGGQAQDMHRVMMKLEESRLSFQLLMQVRGRLLEAYQDVMKMQV
jgi:flagellar hook-basal body complex protein FliE